MHADELCLKAITDMIPKTTAHRMLAHYYSSLIQLNSGPNPNSYISGHFREWIFEQVLGSESREPHLVSLVE